MAKGIRAINRIKEEHQADERTIDGRGSEAFGEQVITIRFGINGCDLGRDDARVVALEPGGKATSILRLQGNGFGTQVWTMGKLFLLGSNLMPHDVSLLSAQFFMR